jgi:hypothetical protein
MANFKTQQVDVKISDQSTSLNVLPRTGHIIPFAGPSNKIPAGWVLCDGTNGTPDLRGKLVGNKSSVVTAGTQTHNHTITPSIGTFSNASSSHSSTINAANIGGNSNNHTHNMGGSVYAVDWGDSGPANRSTGTQSNVIGRFHSHGGTTSANATALGSGNQSANHGHGYSAYSVNATTSNEHTHSLAAQPTVSSQSITHNSLPSIFYVNFIMKV